MEQNSVKKKRVSKKNKISWRKHSDITDVESFLEDQRLEERTGKAIDKKDEELFVYDVAIVEKKSKLLSKKDRRAQRANRIPKCYAGLENTSKVEDPIVKRNRVRTREERRHPIAKLIDEKKREHGIIPKRQLQSVRDQEKVRMTRATKARRPIKEPVDQDIWEMPTESLKPSKFKFDSPWIARHVVEHNLNNTGTPITKVPNSAFHKRSKLSAIAVPHPGISYNPSLKDHMDLLGKATNKEETIIKTENHLKRVTTAMFTKITAAERDQSRLKELELAILENDIKKEEKQPDEDDETVYRAVNPPVQVKPKDKKARRKQLEQKEIKARLRTAKLEKKKITDIHRLRHHNKDIGRMEYKLKKMRKRKLEKEEERKFEPRRLGRQKFQEEEIDLNPVENLAGNLRNVKQEGSILVDRFVSMQKRNILVPVNDKGLRRRREIKRFVRGTHKVIDENEPVMKKAELAKLAKLKKEQTILQ